MTDKIFEHRRASDGEHVGYMKLTADDAFVPIDLMWNELSPAVSFDVAENLLDELGLTYLAEDWYMYSERARRRVRVRISEVMPDVIVVANAEFGISDDIGTRYTLPNPSANLFRTPSESEGPDRA